MRMAIELGLHLAFDNDSNLGPTAREVKKITFWEVFTYDAAWSYSIGRISQLPRTAINLELPNVLDQLDTKLWTPYTDLTVGGIPDADQAGYTHALLYQFSVLSEIVNDIVCMFYAPRDRFTSKKLLDFNSQYTKWFNNLPQYLWLQEVTIPHVLMLQ